MNKRYKILQVYILISFFIIGCLQNKDTLTQDEAYELRQVRYEDFKNSLLMFLEIVNITKEQNREDFLTPYSITIKLSFKNISSRLLVFKKPRSTGFNNLESDRNFPVTLNDVGLVLTRKDKTKIEYNPSSQFSVITPSQDVSAIYLFHTREDFIKLPPEQTYSYTVELKIPVVYLENQEGDIIPHGIYNLYAIYGNDAIGYHDEGIIQIDNLSSSLEKNIIDINAWVGNIVSNTVEMNISE